MALSIKFKIVCLPLRYNEMPQVKNMILLTFIKLIAADKKWRKHHNETVTLILSLLTEICFCCFFLIKHSQLRSSMTELL